MHESHRSWRNVIGVTVAGGLVLAAPDAHAKKIALEAAPASCVTQAGDVYPRVATLLTARGHAVTIVAGTDIDTPAKIGVFDAVAFGGAAFACDWDWATFDPVLKGYVNGGGGLVVSGWGAYFLANNPKNETYAGLEAVLPVIKGVQFGTAGTISVAPGHAITQGLADFAGPDFDNYGAGFQVGSTILLRQGGTDAAAAWSYGAGRSVYLGPDYLANWTNYANEPLLDGTTPDAQELFLRSVEWAAASIDVPKIGAAPKALDLGMARVGAAAQADVTVSNTGDKVLTITALGFAGANPGEFTASKAVPFDVAIGASAPLTVKWTPITVGARSATLTLTSSDVKTPKPVITLAGTAISPDLKVAAALDFGAVKVGAIQGRDLVLTNDGTDTLSVTSASVTGAGAARFTLTPTTFPITVPTGQAVKLSLAYSPSAAATDIATLTIASDGTMSGSSLVALSGSGNPSGGGGDGGVLTPEGGSPSASHGGSDGGDGADGTGGNTGGGCGCRMVPASVPEWPLGLSVVGVGLLLARRRRLTR